MNQNNPSALGFCEVLGLLFIALKLMNVIHWSWFLVLLPLYFPLPVLGGSLVFMTIWEIIESIVKKMKKKKSEEIVFKQ